MLPQDCQIRYAKLSDLPLDGLSASDCLSAAEYQQWKDFRSPARQCTYLAGRLLAKRLLLEELPQFYGTRSTTLSISTGSGTQHSSRPMLTCKGILQSYCLSISHSAQGVLVAVCPQRDFRIGVDLVSADQLGEGFTRAWFTAEEYEGLRKSVDITSAVEVWAIKEAVYKACNEGEPFQPRRIEAFWTDGRWVVRYHDLRQPGRLKVRTWRQGQEVAALALFEKSFTSSKFPPNPASIRVQANAWNGALLEKGKD